MDFMTITPTMHQVLNSDVISRKQVHRPVELDAAPPSDQRRYYESIRDGQRKGNVLPNVGRVQQDGLERYEQFWTAASRLQQFILHDMEQPTNAVAKNESSAGAATAPNLGYRVLEVLDGFVDQISEGVAYVTLKSQFGDVLHGEYPASELNRRGILEGRGFRCMTIEANGKVSANIEAIPERKLTPQEQLALFDEADKRLGDFEWDE